jgi:eukaryotic-like serine/threonine-protein kinase
LQTAHDVATNLRWAADTAHGDTAKSRPQLNKGRTAGVGALLLALVAAAGFIGYRWAQSSNQPVSLHAEIPPPEKFLFDATGDVGGMPVLSPQGDKLAFVAHSGDSKLLWVRSLSNDAAQALDGTSGAAHPFWSPDGSYLGFFAGGKLMKIPAAGGPVATLADAPNPRGGTWSINDVIVFEGQYIDGLMKVNAQGGAAEPATVLDRTKHSTHRWPWFLPDGKHFLFLATNHTGGDPKQNGIYFGSVDNKETHLIVNAESGAEYASGYLLYRLNTALVAQAFDPQSGMLSGSPISLLNNLRDSPGGRPAGPSVTRALRFAHVNARSRCTYPPSTQICWPVMCLARSETKNTVIDAISSEVVIRFSSGIFESIDFSFSSGCGKV